MPLAPTRTFAAPLLGTVGPVTAEIVKKSKGRLAPGDTAGLSGLQARYDEKLAGQPGIQVEAVGDDGEQRELISQDPENGQIGRANVWTKVTNAQTICSILLE